MADPGPSRTVAAKAGDASGGSARPPPSHASPERAELEALQRTLGNRAMGQLVQAAALPGISDPDVPRALRTAALLRRLGAHLGLGVSDVEIRVDAEAARRTRAGQSPGLAEGGVVYLDPVAYDGRSRRSLEILGHELVHVAQARSPAAARAATSAAALEAAEVEAATLARASANGRRLHRPRLGLAPGQAAAFSLPDLGAGRAAALAGDPMAALDLARGAFELPLIGSTLRQAADATTSRATAALLSVDPALLAAAAQFLQNPDAELGRIVAAMQPYADSVPQNAHAKADEYLAPLRQLGEPMARILDALGLQLSLFALQWPTVVKGVLRSVFVPWDWEQEKTQLADLDTKYNDGVIDFFDYWFGVVRVILGGIDRVAGFISLAIWLFSFTGAAAAGAGAGGTVGAVTGAGSGVVLGGATGLVGGGGVGAVPGAAAGGTGGAATVGTAGATVGTGAGAGVGGLGGAAIFQAIGKFTQAASVVTEVAAIGKAVGDLAVVEQTKKATEEDYNQIASGLITLAIMAAFHLLGSFAGAIAKKFGAKLKQLAARASASPPAPAAAAAPATAAGSVMVPPEPAAKLLPEPAAKLLPEPAAAPQPEIAGTSDFPADSPVRIRRDRPDLVAVPHPDLGEGAALMVPREELAPVGRPQPAAPAPAAPPATKLLEGPSESPRGTPEHEWPPAGRGAEPVGARAPRRPAGARTRTEEARPEASARSPEERFASLKEKERRPDWDELFGPQLGPQLPVLSRKPVAPEPAAKPPEPAAAPQPQISGASDFPADSPVRVRTDRPDLVAVRHPDLGEDVELMIPRADLGELVPVGHPRQPAGPAAPAAAAAPATAAESVMQQPTPGAAASGVSAPPTVAGSHTTAGAAGSPGGVQGQTAVGPAYRAARDSLVRIKDEYADLISADSVLRRRFRVAAKLAPTDPTEAARRAAALEEELAKRTGRDVADVISEETRRGTTGPGEAGKEMIGTGETGVRKKAGRSQPLAAEAGIFTHSNAESLRTALPEPRIPLRFATDVAAGDVIPLSQLPHGLLQEVPLGVTSRVDRITPTTIADTANGIIYEIKPDNEQAIVDGLNRALEYSNLANAQARAGRTDWKHVVVVYNQRAAKRLIRRPP